MAQANTHPRLTPPVTPPQTDLQASAPPFVPNKGKGRIAPEHETRVQIFRPQPTRWLALLDSDCDNADTPVPEHLRRCQDKCRHRSSFWDQSERHNGEEKVYKMGYSPSQDCKRRDRYWKLPSAIIPDYTARHFATLKLPEDQQLDVFRQVLADVDPVVKKFHHHQQVIAETKGVGRKGKGQQRDVQYHTECNFSQLQAYHGAGSVSDEIEYWQIHVLGKEQWYDVQERILDHALVEEHRAVGGIIEALARLRHRNRYNLRSNTFCEDQGVEFGGLVREYLVSNLRGFLPDDRPILGWDAIGNVEWYGCRTGANASVLSNKPDARKAADSYEHQAMPV